MAGSALYSEILEVVAADVRAKGQFGELLAPVGDAPYADAVGLRLLAGLHRLVLEGLAPELAAHYPSVGGCPGGRESLRAGLLSVLGAQRPALDDAVRANVQTNEVGRCVALLGGFIEASEFGFPLRILEVGASAGLNLWFDRYRYDAGGISFGPANSALRFNEPWASEPPNLASRVLVQERLGCDANPIDLTTPKGALMLRSFVWADQLNRLSRLDAALDAVESCPFVVERADALDWLRPQLGSRVTGTTTVVFHSIVMQYLGHRQRTELVSVIEAAGAEATSDSPLCWLRFEPGGDQATLRLTMWPAGESRVLATSAYHGPPVVWRPRLATS